MTVEFSIVSSSRFIPRRNIARSALALQGPSGADGLDNEIDQPHVSSSDRGCDPAQRAQRKSPEAIEALRGKKLRALIRQAIAMFLIIGSSWTASSSNLRHSKPRIFGGFLSFPGQPAESPGRGILGGEHRSSNIRPGDNQRDDRPAPEGAVSKGRLDDDGSHLGGGFLASGMLRRQKGPPSSDAGILRRGNIVRIFRVLAAKGHLDLARPRSLDRSGPRWKPAALVGSAMTLPFLPKPSSGIGSWMSVRVRLQHGWNLG